MQKKTVVTALAVALGLSAPSPALWAAHHEGSGTQPTGSEATPAPEGMPQEAGAGGATGTDQGSMTEGSEGGMTGQADGSASDSSN